LHISNKTTKATPPLRVRRLTEASGGARIRSGAASFHLEYLLPQLSLHTPVGDLTVSEDDGAIVALDWGWGRDQSETPLLLEARQQLQDYFDGERHSFTLPLAPFGTEYRRRVWQALCEIPAGQTRTYAELAATAGGSARSVGTAMANNPIPILIPCHRIVASAGPGGYSGGDGLPTKFFLLTLEQEAQASSQDSQPIQERT